MGRVRRDWLTMALSHTGLRLWLVTVIPTTATFVLALLTVRELIRRELGALSPETLAVGEAIGYVFPLRDILLATLGTMLLSSWLTAMAWRPTVRRFREAARVAAEMAQGNYGVRAGIHRYDSLLYKRLAQGINALADSLQQTDRLRRDLVSNLAHEIRTPLTNLQGYLEALRDGVIEPKPEALASVHEEVMRLVRLVDALHRLARADALRHQPITFTAVEMDALVEQLVGMMRLSAETRSIRIYLDLGARDRQVPAHADSVAQVLRNLLRNAVQYTNDGGVIRVQTTCAEGVYRFTCLNTGEGIPREDLPFIFQRFYRSSRARNTSSGGVGIGLAIARELVEAHGGRIGAESKAGWTTFWFELPLEQPDRLEQGVAERFLIP